MVILFYVMPARLLDCPGGSYEVSPLWDRIGLLLANRKLVPGGPSRMFPPSGRMSGGGPSGYPPPFLALWPCGPGSPVRGVPFAFRRAPFPELSGLLSGPAQEIQVVLVPSLSLLG